MYSNDPKQPQTTLSLGCSVKPYIAVTPSEWVKLEGYEGDTITKRVTIASQEDQPLAIENITCTIEDKVAYTLETIKEGREYSLEIKNRSTQEGSFNGKVELKTNSPKKPIVVVNIYSRFRARVNIQPAKISLGTIERSKLPEKNVARVVTLNDLKGEVLKVKKCKSSAKWISAKVEQQEQGKKCSVVISLDSTKAPAGKLEEHVTIYTGVRKEPYVVEIQGSVL